MIPLNCFWRDRIFLKTIQANANPKRLFVQKSNNHRGIRIQPVSELDLETQGTFVQEYIHQPLLIGLIRSP